MPRVGGHEGPDRSGRNGGLVGAPALHHPGVDVQLFETGREVKPLGVGIKLLAHIMASGRQTLLATVNG